MLQTYYTLHNNSPIWCCGEISRARHALETPYVCRSWAYALVESRREFPFFTSGCGGWMSSRGWYICVCPWVGPVACYLVKFCRGGDRGKRGDGMVGQWWIAWNYPSHRLDPRLTHFGLSSDNEEFIEGIGIFWTGMSTDDIILPWPEAWDDSKSCLLGCW